MRWFRIAAISFTAMTQLIALAFVGMIFMVLTSSSHARTLDADPNYNGTLPIYIVILISQFALISTSFLGFYIAYKNWENNYQMDHDQRTRFVSFIGLWSLFVLVNLGGAIYIIVEASQPQNEMSHLYNMFGRHNQEKKFLEKFEKYQKEKGCCGIYGPDDWFMLQLRPSMGGGGGGGGYQTADSDFKQNPSTGNCHLTTNPPTVPKGCGRIILEEIHLQLGTFALIMIIESLFGMTAGSFATYCFFYWLEKEVIVIPEDEVSNLIIVEPDSNTDTAMPVGSQVGGGNSYAGGGSQDYPSPPPPPPGSSYIPSQGPGVVSGSQAGRGTLAQSNPEITPPIHMASHVSAKPHSEKNMLHKQEKALGGKLLGEMHVDHSKDSLPELGDSNGKGKKKHHATIALVKNMKAPKPKTIMAAAADSGKHGQTGHLAEDIAAMSGNAANAKLDDVVLPVGHGNNAVPPGGYLKKLEKENKEKEAEAVLNNKTGGNVGGVDMQNILSSMLDPVAIAHAKNIAVAVLEAPVVKPHLATASQNGEHQNAKYLGAGSHQNAHYLGAGGHENARYLGAGGHENARYLGAGGHENARYLGAGGHENARYLGAGGHENARYLEDGGHENARYLEDGGHGNAYHDHENEHRGSHQNAHYLPAGARGSHENARYLGAGGHNEHRGSHQNAHYLPAGARGSHENARYLGAGGHDNAHHLEERGHENARYLEDGGHGNAYHRGSHQNAHYLNDGHTHRGSYPHNAPYLPLENRGSHENALYLPAGGIGSHENAHYLPNLPQNGPYLPQNVPGLPPIEQNVPIVGSQLSPQVANNPLQDPMNIAGPSQPKPPQNLLQKQEKALGGKLLGEMHVDHSKDSKPEIGDSKGTGEKKHHATIALVKNTKAPKPKKLFAD